MYEKQKYKVYLQKALGFTIIILQAVECFFLLPFTNKLLTSLMFLRVVANATVVYVLLCIMFTVKQVDFNI